MSINQTDDYELSGGAGNDALSADEEIEQLHPRAGTSLKPSPTWTAAVEDGSIDLALATTKAHDEANRADLVWGALTEGVSSAVRGVREATGIVPGHPLYDYGAPVVEALDPTGNPLLSRLADPLKGAMRGATGSMGAFARGVEQYGETLGLESVKSGAGTIADMYNDVAKSNLLKARVATLADIRKQNFVVDVVDYAIGGASEAVGSSVPFFAAGLAGGLPALLGVGYTTSLGELRDELKEGGIKDEGTIARYAYLAAVPHALLDTLTERGLIKGLSDPARQQLRKGLIRLIATTGAKEGVTEGLQRVIEIGAVAHANGGDAPESAVVAALMADYSAGLRSTILESTVKGALGGGMFGVASYVTQGDAFDPAKVEQAIPQLAIRVAHAESPESVARLRKQLDAVKAANAARARTLPLEAQAANAMLAEIESVLAAKEAQHPSLVQEARIRTPSRTPVVTDASDPKKAIIDLEAFADPIGRPQQPAPSAPQGEFASSGRFPDGSAAGGAGTAAGTQGGTDPSTPPSGNVPGRAARSDSLAQAGQVAGQVAGQATQPIATQSPDSAQDSVATGSSAQDSVATDPVAQAVAAGIPAGEAPALTAKLARYTQARGMTWRLEGGALTVTDRAGQSYSVPAAEAAQQFAASGGSDALIDLALGTAGLDTATGPLLDTDGRGPPALPQAPPLQAGPATSPPLPTAIPSGPPPLPARASPPPLPGAASAPQPPTAPADPIAEARRLHAERTPAAQWTPEALAAGQSQGLIRVDPEGAPRRSLAPEPAAPPTIDRAQSLDLASETIGDVVQRGTERIADVDPLAVRRLVDHLAGFDDAALTRAFADVARLERAANRVQLLARVTQGLIARETRRLEGAGLSAAARDLIDETAAHVVARRPVAETVATVQMATAAETVADEVLRVVRHVDGDGREIVRDAITQAVEQVPASLRERLATVGADVADAPVDAAAPAVLDATRFVAGVVDRIAGRDGVRAPEKTAADLVAEVKPARPRVIIDIHDGLADYDGLEIAEGSVKTAFLKDANRFLKKVAKELEGRGFGPHIDTPARGRKKATGKPMPTVWTNEAGPAVSGDVSLSMVDADGNGIYVTISQFMGPGVQIMARRASKEDRYGTRSQNIWLQPTFNSRELADRLTTIARPNKPTPVTTPTADRPAPTYDLDAVRKASREDEQDAALETWATSDAIPDFSVRDHDLALAAIERERAGPRISNYSSMDLDRLQDEIEASRIRAVRDEARQADLFAPRTTPLVLYRGVDPTKGDARFADPSRESMYWTPDLERARGYAGAHGQVLRLEVPAERVKDLQTSQMRPDEVRVPEDLRSQAALYSDTEPGPEAGPEVSRESEKGFKIAAQTARAYVLKEGKRTGTEYGVMGFPDGRTKRNAVEDSQRYLHVSSETAPELYVEDAPNSVDFHHNHPKSSSFSRADYTAAAVRPALRRTWVHGHDGSEYWAEFIVRDAAFLGEAYDLAKAATALIPDSQKKDRPRYRTHLIAQMLAEAGLIRYEAVLAPADAAKVVARLTEAMGAHRAEAIAAIRGAAARVLDNRAGSRRQPGDVGGAPDSAAVAGSEPAGGAGRDPDGAGADRAPSGPAAGPDSLVDALAARSPVPVSAAARAHAVTLERIGTDAKLFAEIKELLAKLKKVDLDAIAFLYAKVTKPTRSKAGVIAAIEAEFVDRAQAEADAATLSGDVSILTRDQEAHANDRRTAQRERRVRESQRALSEGGVSQDSQADEDGRDAGGASGGDGRGSRYPVSVDRRADEGEADGRHADAVPREGGEVAADADRGERDRDGGSDPRTTAALIRKARAEREARRRLNYRITDEDGIGEGGPKAKVRANIEAIRTVKRLAEENRPATPEEKKALVRYVGWGAFAQDVFADHKDEWKTERAQLADLLSAEEYEAARASTLNAHYTSRDVVTGMWAALERLGFKGGRALEPSAGVGHFIGLAPEKIAAATDWTAVELDRITGAIAKALYEGSDVRVQGFETVAFPDNFFDLAISNVPFGSYTLSDRKYPKLLIHDYFFAKSLDKVRPGGVVAFITSSGTLDKASESARRLIASKADFLGAIRLPGGSQGAFAGNAGTEVTTDIVFLRKRGPGEAEAHVAPFRSLKPIETPDGPVSINEYFADHPAMMLGEMRLTGTMYRERSPVLVGTSENLAERIRTAAESLPRNVMADRARPVEDAGATGALVTGVKEGAYFLKGGKLYQNVLGEAVPQKASGKVLKRLRRLIAMRDIVNDLLAGQTQTGKTRTKDSARDHLRTKLNAAYDAFVEEFGPLTKPTVTVQTRKVDGETREIIIRRYPNQAGFADDPDAYKVFAIENYDEETGKASKAAIFSTDVVAPYRRPEIAGPADALAVSLNETGGVDIAGIAEMLAVSPDEAAAQLADRIYLDPNGETWQLAEIYLSGDVVAKLEAAREAAKADTRYARNVAALEAVQPAPLTRVDIRTTFGAPWIPQSVINEYIARVIGLTRGDVKFEKITSTWVFADSTKPYVPPSAQNAYGTDRVSVKDILLAALNSQPVKVYDTFRDDNGKETRVLNTEATQQADAKIKLVQETFTGDPASGTPGWIWEDEARAEQLEALYNHTFNRLVPTKYDGSHLTLPGLALAIQLPSGETEPFSLRPHQKNAVARIVQSGNTLMDHAVGAGKTFAAIAAGMEMKRLGMVQRPMYIVPNHMLEQFSREFLQAYPAARILVAQKTHMEAKNRKAFAARIAAEKWDAIIITHSAFGRLPMQDEAYLEFMRSERDEIVEAYEEANKEDGRSPTTKMLERKKKQVEAKIDKLMAKERKDSGVTFEDLGVDFLFVDEAHAFKNLDFHSRHATVKGLGVRGSQRATDLYLKVRHLEKSRPQRAAVFMTSTPLSRSMAEIYTMQRYLQQDMLREYGIERFDTWAATFGRIVTKTEQGVNLKLKDVASFSKFINVPELQAIYSRVADSVTANDLDLPRPDLEGGQVQVVVSEMSPAEEAMTAELIEKMAQLKGPAEKGKDNHLSLFTKTLQVATDARLYDASAQPNPAGKVAKMVAKVTEIYKSGKKPALAQIIFLDMGVPGSKARSKPKVADAGVAEDESRVDAIRAKLAGEEDVEDTTSEEDAEVDALLAGKFNLYQDIIDRLVANGVPRKEIATIHDAKNDAQKATLFKAVREGKVRILIGSSAKMGVGTNVQRYLTAMHHVDAPWNPADVVQRDGRILRQGNENKKVSIFRYITEKSADAYRWQILARKAEFEAQFRAGARGLREAEDIDSPIPEASVLKALATGDPRIMEHAELTKEIRELDAARRGHERSYLNARKSLTQIKADIASLEAQIAKHRQDVGLIGDLKGDKFAVRLDLPGTSGEVRDRKTAGEAIRAHILSKMKSHWGRDALEIDLGSISGFKMQVRARKSEVGVVVKFAIEGAAFYLQMESKRLSAESDPVGIARQFENLVAGIPGLLARSEQSLAEKTADMPRLEARSKPTPFPKALRLVEAKARHEQLERELKPQDKPAEPTGEQEEIDVSARIRSLYHRIIGHSDLLAGDAAMERALESPELVDDLAALNADERAVLDRALRRRSLHVVDEELSALAFDRPGFDQPVTRNPWTGEDAGRPPMSAEAEAKWSRILDALPMPAPSEGLTDDDGTPFVGEKEARYTEDMRRHRLARALIGEIEHDAAARVSGDRLGPDRAGGEDAQGASAPQGADQGGAGRDGARQRIRARLADRGFRARAIDAFLSEELSTEARNRRAREQGFVVIGYHGTTTTFAVPDPFRPGRDFGFHVGLDSPRAANSRLGYPSTRAERWDRFLSRLFGFPERSPDPERGHIVPVRLRVSNPLRLPDVGHHGASWADPIAMMKLLTSPRNRAPEALSRWVRDWVQQNRADDPAQRLNILRSQRFSMALAGELTRLGYDAIVYRNMVEGYGHDSMFVWDKARVRSAFDFFHPDAAGASGLMASDPYVERDLTDRLTRWAEEEGLVEKPAQTFADLAEDGDVEQVFALAARDLDGVRVPRDLVLLGGPLRTRDAVTGPTVARLVAFAARVHMFARRLGNDPLDSHGYYRARADKEALDARGLSDGLTTFAYTIRERKGGKVAQSDIGTVDGFVVGDTMYIDWIGGGRNAIGLRTLKALREQVRKDFPSVTRFAGYRISGARERFGAQGPVEIEMPALAPRNEKPFTVWAARLDPHVRQRIRERGLEFFAYRDSAALTPAAEAVMPQMTAALGARLQRMSGGAVDIRFAHRLFDRMGNEQHGRFSPLKHLVTLALSRGVDVALQYGAHEIVHVLRNADAFTDTEWAALVERARKVGVRIDRTRYEAVYMAQARELRLSPDLARQYVARRIEEEMVAHLAQQFFGPQQARFGTLIDGLLRRLRDILDSLVAVLNGEGLHTPEAIFRRMDRGLIAKRIPKSERRRGAIDIMRTEADDRRAVAALWDVAALAQGREEAYRGDVRRMVQAGQPVSIPLEYAESAMAAIEPLLGEVPSGYRVGALVAIRPEGAGSDVATFVFEQADGDRFTIRQRISALLDPDREVRALHARGRIGFLRFAQTAAGSDAQHALQGELRHEIVHAFWLRLSDAGRARLVDHANRLRVLDTPMVEFALALGMPLDGDPSLTLRDLYEAYYRRLNVDPQVSADKIAQEAVAHMAELAHHGYFGASVPASVRDLLDGRFADSIREETNPDDMAASLRAIDRDTGRSMRRVLDTLGFYSKLDEVLATFKPTDKVTAATLLQRGVKAAEIEARGLNELFHRGPNPASQAVPVSDLMAVAEQNKVAVRENAYRAKGLTTWSDYSLDPSNPSYRETVLYLPRKNKSERAFRSIHFSESNIIGHLLTSMVWHEGKLVYLIDQIQSDWAQTIRDERVWDEAKIAELKEQIESKMREADAKADLGREMLIADGYNAHFVSLGTWRYIMDWLRDVTRIPGAQALYRELSQLQQDLFPLQEALFRAEHPTPGHPLVDTTDQWTTTTLRRAIRQAVEAGAEYIAIPHGDTVLSYNPGRIEGMRGFYGTRTSEGIVPKNLRKLLEKIDKDSGKPVRAEKMETTAADVPQGWKGDLGPDSSRPDERWFDPDQTGFTLFPLTDKVRQAVITEGQPLFALAGGPRRRPTTTTRPFDMPGWDSATVTTRMKEDGLSTRVYEVGDDSGWRGRAALSEVEPGLWQVIGVRLDPLQYGKGLAPKLLDAIARDLGRPLSVDGILTDAAYQAVLAETPEKVRHYVRAGREMDGLWLSPDSLDMMRQAAQTAEAPESDTLRGLEGRIPDAHFAIARDLAGIADVVEADDTLAAYVPTPPRHLSQIGQGSTAEIGDIAVGLSDLVAMVNEALDTETRHGRLNPGLKAAMAQMGAKLYGQFSRTTGLIRLAIPLDLQTLAHEGGHKMEVHREHANGIDAFKTAHSAELLPLASPGKDQLSEGWAEFFRLFLLDPNAAQTAAPTAYAGLRTYLEANDPALLIAFETIQTAHQRLVTASPAGAVKARVKSTVRPTSAFGRRRQDIAEQGLKEATATWLDNATTAVVDAKHPLRIARDILVGEAEKNAIAAYEQFAARSFHVAGRPLPADLDRLAGGEEQADFIRLGHDLANGSRHLFLKAANDPYKRARLMEHARVHATAVLQNGVRLKGATTGSGPSMQDVLATAFGGYGRKLWNEDRARDFGAYLVARRMNAEWDRYDAGEIASPPDHLLTRDAWGKALSQYEQAFPEFPRAARMLDAFLAKVLEWKFQNGFISQDLYDELSSRKSYAPLNRIMDENKAPRTTAGGTNKRALLFRFKGSTRDFINPIESIIADVYQTQARVEINDTIKALDKLARSAGPNGGIIAERIPTHDFKARQIDLRPLVKRLKAETQKIVESAVNAGAIQSWDASQLIDDIDALFDANASMTLFSATATGERGERIVYLWEGGQRVPILLGSDSLGREIWDMIALAGKPVAEEWWLNGAVLATQLFRAGTTKSAAYIAVNWFRDQVVTWILSPDFKPFWTGLKGLTMISQAGTTGAALGTAAAVATMATGGFTSLLLPLGGAVAGAIAGNRLLDRALPTDTDPLQRYQFFGGIQGGIDATIIDSMGRGRDPLELRRSGFFAAPTWLQSMFKMSEVSEAASRVGHMEAVYQRLLNDGFSEEEAAIEAAYNAHDVMDFSRHGSRTLLAMRLVAFLNSALQGLSAFTRTAKGERDVAVDVRDVLTPYIKASEGMALSTAEKQALPNSARMWMKMASIGLVGLAIAALYADDPEHEELRQGQMGATHWFVKIAGVWWRIPKPFELAIFSNLFEALFDRVVKEDPKAAERFRRAAFDTLVPPTTMQAWEGLMGLYDLGEDAVEAVIGKDQYKRSRPDLPMRFQGLPPHLQYDAHTSEMSKLIGGVTGMSPYKSDRVVKSLLSTMGRDVLAASDVILPRLNRRLDGVLPQVATEPRADKSFEDQMFISRITRRSARGAYSAFHFWQEMSQDNGAYVEAAKGYKTLLNERKQPREAQAHLMALSPDKRAYALVEAHFKEDAQDLHPFNRAKQIANTITGLRQQMEMGTFSKQFDEKLEERSRGTLEAERIVIRPSTRRIVHEILEDIVMRELRNAQIVIGKEGWKQRAEFGVDGLWMELRAAAPQVADELSWRLANGRNKVYAYDSVKRLWPEAKARLLRDGKDAMLADLAGIALGQSYAAPHR